MQFTPQELKMIERMRKQERQTPTMRWILLGTSVFTFAVCAYAAYFLVSILESKAFEPAETALIFSVLWPKILLMLVSAGVCFGLTIRDWHGNANRMLLLRLLDAQQKGRNDGNV